MSPYRTPASVAIVVAKGRRTLAGRLRSLRRRFTLHWYGTFRQCFPIKCPCGKRSWDPEAVRGNRVPYVNASVFSHRANIYRCGQRHGLLGRVVLC